MNFSVLTNCYIEPMNLTLRRRYMFLYNKFRKRTYILCTYKYIVHSTILFSYHNWRYLENKNETRLYFKYKKNNYKIKLLNINDCLFFIQKNNFIFLLHDSNYTCLFGFRDCLNHVFRILVTGQGGHPFDVWGYIDQHPVLEIFCYL